MTELVSHGWDDYLTNTYNLRSIGFLWRLYRSFSLCMVCSMVEGLGEREAAHLLAARNPSKGGPWREIPVLGQPTGTTFAYQTPPANKKSAMDPVI